MSYAKIATLAPEYGLYSAFVGVIICKFLTSSLRIAFKRSNSSYLSTDSFFATSKDISIGPVGECFSHIFSFVQS